MKKIGYQKRSYRDYLYEGRLFRQNIVLQETDIQLYCDRPIDKEYCLNRIRYYRRQIELYIAKDERFLTSLKPVFVEKTAPAIVRQMASQSKKANVGPMAAVAGAIAQFLAKDLLRKGYKDVIIENGGDIFLKVRRSVAVSIYAGKNNALTNLKIRFLPKDMPLGVCTSSGTIGHSLSFGCADAVTIIARNASFADAVATAAANIVNHKKDLKKAVTFASQIAGVRAVVAVLKKNMACWGKIEFV